MSSLKDSPFVFRERLGESGSPVLLLHGWGCDSSTMRPIAERIADQHTVLIPDMPGHGFDVVLQQGDVLENGAVDPLQDIVIRTVRLHLEGVVDQSAAQRLHRQDPSPDGEPGGDGL